MSAPAPTPEVPLASVTITTPVTAPVTWSLTERGAGAIAALVALALMVGGAWWGVSTWTAAPTFTVADAKGRVGCPIRIEGKGNASDVRWIAQGTGLELSPYADLASPKVMHVTAAQPGTYHVLAVPVHHGHLGDEVKIKVTVGDPGPDPIPPGPVPPVPPVPPTPPSPMPTDGFRALIVYDAAGLGKMPKEQETVLYAKSIRDYLQAKCVTGADGKTKEWRIWPSTVNAAAESKLWQDTLARPRASVPWIVIGGPKGGYEGPLPATVDATLTLLQKFGA